MSAGTAHTADERFLVTGAHGCIGAWVVRQLVTDGTDVVALDVSDDTHRLALLLDPDELRALPSVRIDITDLDLLERTLDEHAITNVVHLAALQVPFCRADPSLGARVNVVGTVNVLEAVARRQGRMAPVVYASSIAAYEEIDAEDGRGASASATSGVPGTLYGVYKRANEGAAALYWRDRGLASIGLRPHTVYGPGRDQGLTSAPTSALLAAAAGQPYEIPYGGRFVAQYAPDVARAFILASRSRPRSAEVHNLDGHAVHMSDVVAAIEAVCPGSAGTITYRQTGLPFPPEVDARSFTAAIGSYPQSSLDSGVADSIQRFTSLLRAGLVSPDDARAPDAASSR